MWVFSRLGFYSVVVDKRNPLLLVIRSRDLQHLRHLAQEFPEEIGEIQTNKNNDYPFRATVTPEAWAFVLSELGKSIDYSNFKDMCDKRSQSLGPRFVKALHEIWFVLYSAANPAKPKKRT